MSLESALAEENEYLRLQKLSEGIKQVTQEILYLKSFTQVSTIKHLLCAYPFQPASVELIITGLFEHFQDEQFVYTFFQATMELATMQEINPMNRRKSKLMDSISMKRLTNKEIHQQTLKYCKSVYENVLEAKKFACSYLKQLFEMATQFELDIQYMATIFKLFVKHSSDTGFLHYLVKKYEECKIELFGNHQWIDDLDDEIIEYFQVNSIPMPFTENKQQFEDPIKLSPVPNSLNRNYSSSFTDSISFDEVDEAKLKLELQYTNMQKWLCIKEIPLLKSRVEYLSDENHFEYLMSFIFHPQKHEIIPDWVLNNYFQEQQFKHLQVDYESSNCKIGGKELQKFEIIRSYKTTQLFLTDDNFQMITSNVPKLIPNMCITSKDNYKNVNLLHVSCILEKFLQKFPKSTVLIMVEMNLFQILGKCIYNNKLASILSDIMDIYVDRYGLESHYQEQLWKYLQKINWFESILSFVEKGEVKFTYLDQNENNKMSQTLRSLTVNEKQRINPAIDYDDKKKLTDMLGILQSGKIVEEYYNTNQLNWQINQNVRENISHLQIETQDIDGLVKFVSQRDSYHQRSLHKIKSSLMLKSARIFQQVKTPEASNSEAIRFAQIQKPILRPSHRKFCESVDLQCNATREVANFSQEFEQQFSKSGPGSSRSSYIRYETNEDEIVSSHRQLSIYPGFKLNFISEEYEKAESKFIINHFYAAEVIETIKQQINSICCYLDDKRTYKIKQDQHKIDFKSIMTCLINTQTLQRLFKLFLYGIMRQSPYEQELGEECSLILNTLYKYVFLYEQLQEVKQILQDSFFSIANYLCKLIVKVYQKGDIEKIQRIKFKQILLLTAFRQGYQLFNVDTQSKNDLGIHKFLHSTVIHILIQWFFSSQNNNIYQTSFLRYLYIFFRFIINIFVKAPVVILSSILFRLGFVGLLFDVYNTYCLNGSEHILLADSLLAHIKCIVYSINAAIIYRQLMVIQQNLNCLDSWKKLIDSVPMIVLSIFRQINYSINPHFNFKHNRINLLNPQMSIEEHQIERTPQVSKYKPASQIHKVQGAYRIPKLLPTLHPIVEKSRILSKTFNKQKA